MASIYVYTVEDADGTEQDWHSDPSFACQPGLDEARGRAQEIGGRVIENTYNWADSEMTDDYAEPEPCLICGEPFTGPGPLCPGCREAS